MYLVLHLCDYGWYKNFQEGVRVFCYTDTLTFCEGQNFIISRVTKQSFNTFCYFDVCLLTDYPEFIQYDGGGEVQRYLVPSQSCIVIHFDKDREMCSHTRSVSQMIEPLDKHLIIRIDKAFLYPPPMSSQYAQYGINFKMTANATKSRLNEIYYDKIILRYLQVQDIKFYQRFQINFKHQENVSVSNYKCRYTIETPFLFVPINIQIYSVEVPRRKELLASKFSFTFFDTYDTFDSISKSWVTSTIYYINCVKIQEAIDLLKLSGKVVTQLCIPKNFSLNSLFPNILVPPYTANKHTSFSYILTFSVPKIIEYNVQFGVLTLQSYWDGLCKYSWNDYGYYKILLNNGTRRFGPSQCTKLHAKVMIHSINFEKDETYKVQLQIWRHPCISLNINSNISNILQKSITYKWSTKELSYSNITKKQYKIFLSKSKYSWYLAFKQCKLLGMSLPYFKNSKHLEEVASLLLIEYTFQAQALFIGFTHSVSILKIIEKLTLLILNFS